VSGIHYKKDSAEVLSLHHWWDKIDSVHLNISSVMSISSFLFLSLPVIIVCPQICPAFGLITLLVSIVSV
jgi:hypothetical protein